MGRDELLRRSLVALAAAVVLTGLATASLRKAAATYGFGILAIAGVLLPDWEFFDRDYSQWLTPMPASRRTAAAAAAAREHDVWKFKPYPLRVAMLTTIYGFGLYKWWMTPDGDAAHGGRCWVEMHAGPRGTVRPLSFPPLSRRLFSKSHLRATTRRSL